MLEGGRLGKLLGGTCSNAADLLDSFLQHFLQFTS